MRILYISHLHPPPGAVLKNIGGMQRVSMQLAEHINAIEGVEIEKITLETGWKFIGVKTTLFLIRLYFFLPAMIRKHQPDVVLFSSMVTGSVASFVRKRVNVPMVGITHGHDVTLNVGMYQWLVPKTFRALDGVISVSSATQEECLSRGLEADKSQVLPNGFNTREIDRLPRRDQALKELEREFGFELGDRKLLLTVGRLIKRKGHAWFISEVLPKVDSDVLYLIVGDGAEKQNILSAVETSGQNTRVVHVGRQPDHLVECAYVAADLFIMPNVRVKGDMEGFGVVLLEANARFTPAIASDLEGIRDVITQGVNGYRIKAGDAQAFAKKIDVVLQGEVDKLSESGRNFVDQQFNWEQVGLDYIDYLKSVVGQKR